MSRPRRPLYFRILRVRHLNLRPSTTFVLFEGSIALGILLTLADLVEWWGMLAVPAAVAIMVKLQDVIAGVLIRPLALAQLRTPRLLDGLAIGRSPAPRPSHPTAEIGADDAVADPAARPENIGVEGVDVTGGAVGESAAAVTAAALPAAAPPTAVPPTAAPPAATDAGDTRHDGPGGAWVARGVASVPTDDPFPGRRRPPHKRGAEPSPSNPESVRPDGADRRSRGNQGRFTS